MQSVTKAIIPAAGYGTRMLPITKAIPKEMLPVGNKPVIHYVVEEAARAGITDILIVVSRGKEAIIEYFDRDPELEQRLESKGRYELIEQLRAISELAHIHFIRQPEMKGLGDAVLQGRAFVGNEPFALLLGDTIIESDPHLMSELVATTVRHQVSTVAVEPVSRDRATRYGVCGGRQIEAHTFDLDEVIEKPSTEQIPNVVDLNGQRCEDPFAFAARYVFQPSVFNFLSEQMAGHGGEIQLTDSMGKILKESGLMGVRLQGRRLDVGSPDFYRLDR